MSRTQVFGPPNPGGRRAGFTLIELLVVIGVIALLVSLVVPAVLASRNAARAAECRNNLKQIGLALHDHVAARGTFPPGNDGWGWGVHVHLLPYLEQKPLYDTFDLDVYWLAWEDANQKANIDAYSSTPSIYRCPSDPASPRNGTVNYLASAGVPWVGLDSGMFRDSPFLGFGAPDPTAKPPLNPAEVRDGLSNTVAFTEVLTAEEAGADPRRRIVLSGVGLPGPQDSRTSWEVFEAQCLDAPASWEWPQTMGGEWLNGSIGSARITHSLPPNRRSCLNDGQPPTGLYSPASEHRGQVHALMGDGSVHAVSDDIDSALWQAAGTVAGGEVVGGLD